jgi:hypothetical protein
VVKAQNSQRRGCCSNSTRYLKEVSDVSCCIERKSIEVTKKYFACYYAKLLTNKIKYFNKNTKNYHDGGSQLQDQCTDVDQC